MTTKLPVMWYEGMPLTPQVLQQQQLFQNEVLLQITKSFNQHFYGVINLEWNDIYITDGVLQIKNLECILPDLSYYNLPIDDTDLLSITLKELQIKSDIYIYITLPDNELAYESNSAKARYIPKDIEGIKDLTNKDTEAQITFLKPDFRLVCDNNLPLGVVGFPICQISFNGISYAFTNYRPPVFKISKNDIISTRLAELAKSGRIKLNYLASKKSDNSTIRLWIANLGAIVFTLEKAISCDYSPFELYKDLASTLANSLAFFSELTLPILPEYKHLNQSESILPMLDFIESAFEKAKESYTKFAFQEQEGLFAIDTAGESIITIGITKKPEQSVDDMTKWLANATIASDDKLIQLQDQRILGAVREFIRYDDTLDVAATETMILAKIKLDKAFATPNRMICIMNLNSKENPEKIELFTIAI